MWHRCFRERECEVQLIVLKAAGVRDMLGVRGSRLSRIGGALGGW